MLKKTNLMKQTTRTTLKYERSDRWMPRNKKFSHEKCMKRESVSRSETIKNARTRNQRRQETRKWCTWKSKRCAHKFQCKAARNWLLPLKVLSKVEHRTNSRARRLTHAVITNEKKITRGISNRKKAVGNKLKVNVVVASDSNHANSAVKRLNIFPCE